MPDRRKGKSPVDVLHRQVGVCCREEFSSLDTLPTQAEVFCLKFGMFPGYSANRRRVRTRCGLTNPEVIMVDLSPEYVVRKVSTDQYVIDAFWSDRRCQQLVGVYTSEIAAERIAMRFRDNDPEISSNNNAIRELPNRH